MAKIWENLEALPPLPRAGERDAHTRMVVEQWRHSGCAVTGAPYVISGLLAYLPDVRNRQWSVLACSFLDEASCAGARGLSQDDKAKLRMIRDRNPDACVKEAKQ
jgi:hypothetical protein